MVTLNEATDELYGASPVDFVSRREALTKQARADKDRALATQIKAMRRPTVSAWVLNTLTREGLQPLTELLEAGAQLRTAQAMLDAAELKRLTGVRQQLERQILTCATARFKELGETLTPATLTEIENTLRAAIADPAAAAALASGHLTRPLTYAGFGEVDLTSATAITPGPAPTAASIVGTEVSASVVRLQDRRPTPAPEDEDEELRAAQQALEEAQERLAQATARRELAAARRTIEAATRRVQAATTARDIAAARVTELTTQLEQAQTALAVNEAELTHAAAELAEAEEVVAAAQATGRG